MTRTGGAASGLGRHTKKCVFLRSRMSAILTPDRYPENATQIAQVVSHFNGMITNDKFCVSRFVQLHLGQWQLPLPLRAEAARQLAYHRERYRPPSSQAGDAYETPPLESPPPDYQLS